MPPPLPDHGRRCSCRACLIEREPGAYARGVARWARLRLDENAPRSRRLLVGSWDGSTRGLSPHLDGPVEPRRALTSGPGDLGAFIYADEEP